VSTTPAWPGHPMGNAATSRGSAPTLANALSLSGHRACGAARTTSRSPRRYDRATLSIRSIGTRALAIRGISATPIDETHQMAKVDFRASYEKTTGERLDIDFPISYLLAARGDSFEIFAYVAGDEMAAYREHGLIPMDRSLDEVE
jgi:hypothetical protein